MQIEKSKIIIVLICCFLGASLIAFLLKRDGTHIPKEKPTDKAGKHQLYESQTQQQLERQTTESFDTTGADPETQSDNIEDLEALSGDLLEGDIGDVMDMEWSSREITSDFSDRNKVAEVIGQFPITSDITVSEEQIDMLRNCVTEMIFNNGNNDYDSYLNFVRKSGETVQQFKIESIRTRLIEKGISEEEISTDPWKLLSEDHHGRKSLWKGLVSEDSNIKIFEAQTSKLPIGKKLKELRGGSRTYNDLTAPPISLDEMLTKKGKVLMADVMFFIAHEDVTGGIVWPYTTRYWFDPINSSWRVQKLVLFRNRSKMWSISVLP